MKRRDFILSGLGFLVIAGVPFVFWAKEKKFSAGIAEVAATPEMLSLIAREEDIIGIGLTAEIRSGKANAGCNLTEILLRNIPEQVYRPVLKPIELRLEISKKIQSDFQSGRTKIVNGWVLSETEVLQCRSYALLSLNN